MKKAAATGSKHIKNYFSKSHQNICHITKWILLIFKNALFFFKIPLRVSLNVLYSDPHNFLKEVTPQKKKENRNEAHKNFFLWPIKSFRKYLMAHQYLPKIFHSPYKNPPPPSYIFNVRFLRKKLWKSYL